VRQCSKYIGKLRFKSVKIAHVSRNNPRKAERVYPSQAEHISLAISVIEGWFDALSLEKIGDLLAGKLASKGQPNQVFREQLRIVIRDKTKTPGFRDLLKRRCA